MSEEKKTKTTFVYPTIRTAFGKVRDDSERIAVKVDEEGNVVSMHKQVKAGIFGTYFDDGEFKP